MTNQQKKLIRFLAENYIVQQPGSDYFQSYGGLGYEDFAFLGMNIDDLKSDIVALKNAGYVNITTRKTGEKGVQCNSSILTAYKALLDADAEAAAEVAATAAAADITNKLTKYISALPDHSDFGALVASIIAKAQQDGLI